MTFYHSTDELPDFHDYSMKGRTYRYLTAEPLYPFGYGLSYTSFAYSDLKLSADKIANGDPVTVSVKVRNTGKMDGDEVVELYIKDNEASVDVPHFSLCGFKRITLAAGEEKEVSLTIRPESMRIVDNDGKRYIEPGTFTVYAGGSAPDALSARLTGSAPLSAVFTVL